MSGSWGKIWQDGLKDGDEIVAERMTRDELKRKKIAVLLGGLSAEREVSLRTGKAVLAALERCGMTAVAIDAGRDLAEVLKRERAEVVFIALHGRYGEDGTVQGMLELLGLPYTGSGVMASSVAMDKVATKKFLLHHGIPTPAAWVYVAGESREAFCDGVSTYPVIAKPAHEGSTIGVTVAASREELDRALDVALEHDGTVLVEEFIRGDEATVSVLDGMALPIIQVVPKGGFYDFTSKYTAGRTEYLLPAPFSAEVTARMQRFAVAAIHALGCRGAARADFMVRGEEIFCLEVNTIPGMTETSLLPKAAAAAGIDFDELVMRLLEGAAVDK